jgi:hypothetical protein
LRNVIKQYPVIYDSDDKMFVVHRESVGKPNMEFRMHESGIHYYDPRNDESHLDDDEHPSEMTLNIDDTEISVVDYAAAIPGVASVKLPGVDVEVAANEIDDLDEPDDNLKAQAESVETAPDAQPAEFQGGTQIRTDQDTDSDTVGEPQSAQPGRPHVCHRRRL